MVESTRYGAIDLAVTSTYTRIWDDRGSGADRNGAFFAPKVSWNDYLTGWRVLAHVGRPSHEDLNNQATALLARSASHDILKPPTDFELIWRDKGSGADTNGAVWRPVPPDGYVALGDVFTSSWTKPDPVWYVCVRKEAGGRRYVREAQIAELIWDDRGSGADADVSVWQVRSPGYPSDSVERLILEADGFVAGNRYDRPSRTVWVLDLPALVVKRTPPEIPVLTSHREPDPIAQVTDRAVTVPCTVVKDPHATPAWQALNSPFYTLERRVNYTLKMFRNNQHGTEAQPDSQAIRTGVSTERSEEFSKRTSVTVTASAGINIKAFSASVETSVTTELGYSSRYGVTQLNDVTTTWSMVTPPRSSGALWAATHEIIAIRKDGDTVGGQGGLTFDVDSRVSGEYPSGAGLKTFVDDTETTADDLKAQPFGEPETSIPDDAPAFITD
ncbi:Vps62-related protein [Streptomyces chrestomyceticus]|uniref:Vps62-related protein n=1 Tax=Streptomyces chrestomyceticus TaxID=68185 RepID=UPI001F49DDAF|nr:Vps62-related protein [Streptomyces chrestomyceticus]